jgi:pimeloyl-ACP methyl ester carboxylesterase
MPATEQRMVPTDGAVLATEAWGEDVRGTMLLAMGATASMVWWPETLMLALAAGGYRVIRFDHRDTGRSTTSPPGEVAYDVHDLAEDLIAVLDAYGVEAAHLVGMSLGGYVGQIAALAHPERVATLTLIAAEPLGVAYAGEGLAPELIQHFGTMSALDWSDRREVTRFMLGIAELSAGPGRPFDRDASLARIELELSRTSSMHSAFNHAMLAGAVKPGLAVGDLRMPVLVIHGSDDPVISVRAAETTVASVRQAELLVLRGTGHELAEPDVPQIAQAILRIAG